MPVISDSRLLERAFLKKGFRKETNSDHIRYFLVNTDGKDAAVMTKISHGMLGKTLSAEIVAKMSRQCHLTKQQFLDFVDCRLSEEAYRGILRQQGFEV